MKHLAVVVLCLGLAACTKKKKEEAPPTPTPASGSTMAGSGSAAGSGSDMAGSGSAMAGSGSAAAGSGSDAAGSGSAAGSAAGSASGSAAGAGSGSAAIEEKTAFQKLSAEEKADFMKKKVVPPMKAAFQKFDAKEFANFGCKTCHGKDPKKSKYKMPNPELPKLDFDALKAGKDKKMAKAAEFMGTAVKPEMAKILELKEMDPAHPELGGFGCLECHEMKK